MNAVSPLLINIFPSCDLSNAEIQHQHNIISKLSITPAQMTNAIMMIMTLCKISNVIQRSTRLT